MANERQTAQTEEKQGNYPVSMRELLESGVHFGHQTRRWNPKMDTYIYTSRNDIHVIDLQQTVELIKDAYNFVKDTVAKRELFYLLVLKSKLKMPLPQKQSVAECHLLISVG